LFCIDELRESAEVDSPRSKSPARSVEFFSQDEVQQAENGIRSKIRNLMPDASLAGVGNEDITALQGAFHRHSHNQHSRDIGVFATGSHTVAASAWRRLVGVFSSHIRINNKAFILHSKHHVVS
jgi:hypothetical protein